MNECDICEDRESIEDIHAYWPGLCDQHYSDVLTLMATNALRAIIPADLHAAKPSELRSELRSWKPNGYGLYLYGPVGVGKSYDAAALIKSAWATMRRNGTTSPSAAWVNVVDMVDEMMRSFGTNREYNSSWQSADLLVLDDIGCCAAKEFAVRRLYTVIEYRLHHRLSTIVVSNRDLEDLADYLDSPQIASRLSQICSQVSYEGLPDRRVGLAPKLGEN